MEKPPEGWNDIKTGKTGKTYELLLPDGETTWGFWTTTKLWWSRGAEVTPIAWRELPKRNAMTYHPNRPPP